MLHGRNSSTIQQQQQHYGTEQIKELSNTELSSFSEALKNENFKSDKTGVGGHGKNNYESVAISEVIGKQRTKLNAVRSEGNLLGRSTKLPELPSAISKQLVPMGVGKKGGGGGMGEVHDLDFKRKNIQNVKWRSGHTLSSLKGRIDR